MVCARCPRGEDCSVAAACCTEDATGLELVGATELLPGDSACRHSLGSGEGSLGSGEGSLGSGKGSLGSSEDCTEAPGA